MNLDEVKTWMNSAFEALEDSKIALDNERYKMSLNRSYYATFYAATALLVKKGIYVKTHSGTIQRFGFEYVVNGNFDGEIAKIFSDLEDDRENADYESNYFISEDHAIDNYDKAEIFVFECENYI
ncbi:MAG: HEPN domain-containing protein [Methanobrevibacter sp.]|jgi:uncharacterized protein (UPF0332 family)|nr:HEPN domain-containing protein [Candidatus Methanoflexus mossambicus]